MPTKIQGGLGIDKVQDGTVGLSDVDTELYGKITALTTINLGEAKTASGTVVDFVGIPEGVKRITAMFDGVSTNGASLPVVRLGAGTVDASGYNSSVFGQISGASGAAAISTGFGVHSGVAAPAVTRNGALILTKTQGDTWYATGTFSDTGATHSAGFSSGTKTLSGPLDRLRITTVNGTDTFDAGTINISWEF